MYLSYWQLDSEPFPYRAEPRQLYQARTTQAASLRLRYCFANNAGAALLLGVSGVGKSSLLQQLKFAEEDLHPFAHLTFPVDSPEELLQAVVAEVVGKPAPADTTLARLSAIREIISESTAAQRHAVIVFDEAHLLGQEALNQVVLPLLNLAVTDRSLQYSVVLAGHPVLASQIAKNAQLRERVSVTATLDGFTLNETTDYIETRLLAAGAQRELFAADAIEAVFELSDGNPRRINRLCDMSLLVGYADQRQTITAAQVQSLSSEFLPRAA